MITRVRVKNFRSIADADVELGPLTVLVGRNGSGKSAFIDALRFVRDATQIGLDLAVERRAGLQVMKHHFSIGEVFIAFDFEFVIENKKSQYGFSLTTSNQNIYVSSEYCKVAADFPKENSEFSVKSGRLVNISDETLSTVKNYQTDLQIEHMSLALPIMAAVSRNFSLVRDALDGNYYTEFSRGLWIPQTPLPNDEMKDMGINFASVLQKLARTDAIIPVNNALSRIVSDIKSLRCIELGDFLLPQVEHEYVNDGHKNTIWRDLGQESAGTVRASALLVALKQIISPQKRMSPLAIEEPEIALHPGALAVMADEIREAASSRQIIITTQSPDLISRFRAEELRVVERVNGATQIGRLDETQREVIERELFSAGDLLRIEGLRPEPVRAPSTGE